jgi:A/G-specific adenine glycosylase
MVRALDAPRRLKPDANTERFHQLLTDWRARTDVWSPPWRQCRDPWMVLAGELLLARARRHDAEELFDRLRKTAPTPAGLLAHAHPEEALTRIGISERASVLVRIAGDLIDFFAGSVPDDEMALRMLPGVGDYVCQATLTFGFGRRQVLVDRTTARVVGRISGEGDSRRFQQRLDLHRLAGSAGPDPEFNRALLDLGREICRPQQPHCGRCPVQGRCATGRMATVQLELPERQQRDQESVAA